MEVEEMKQQLLTHIDSKEFSLSLKVDISSREVILLGDQTGLLYLALTCLQLASNRPPGSHAHFDSFTSLKHAEGSLVIEFQPD